jgi:hypothetical protein
VTSNPAKQRGHSQRQQVALLLPTPARRLQSKLIESSHRAPSGPSSLSFARGAGAVTTGQRDELRRFSAGLAMGGAAATQISLSVCGACSAGAQAAGRRGHAGRGRGRRNGEDATASTSGRVLTPAAARAPANENSSLDAGSYRVAPTDERTTPLPSRAATRAARPARAQTHAHVSSDHADVGTESRREGRDRRDPAAASRRRRGASEPRQAKRPVRAAARRAQNSRPAMNPPITSMGKLETATTKIGITVAALSKMTL